jgi:hypothetical protein
MDNILMSKVVAIVIAFATGLLLWYAIRSKEVKRNGLSDLGVPGTDGQDRPSDIDGTAADAEKVSEGNEVGKTIQDASRLQRVR